MNYNRRQFREQDYAVRPVLRIAGALLLGFLVFVLLIQVPRTFQLEAIPAEQCRAGKGLFLCEFGNWINAVTPPSLQGPLAALGQVATAVLLVLTMWWLVAPLLRAVTSRRGG